jgi:hypothetical protein
MPFLIQPDSHIREPSGIIRQRQSTSDEEFARLDEHEFIDHFVSSTGLPPEWKSEYINRLKEQELPSPHDTPSERDMLKYLFDLVESEIADLVELKVWRATGARN